MSRQQRWHTSLLIELELPMPRYLAFGLCLMAPFALAANDTAPVTDHDLAYSLGASLGSACVRKCPACNWMRW